MADSETGEVVPKFEPLQNSESGVIQQEEEISKPIVTQNELAGRAGLPERPRSRSPSENNHFRGEKRKDSHNRQQGGGRGRRKPPPPYAGRGPPARSGRLSPGPPPMPPPGPPPAGYRRPDRLDSPTPHRRGRSPEPLRRRTPPPLPPAAPSLPPPPSYGRSRYNSPPRRSPPPARRWPGTRSRSPPPRGYRSPPGPRRRRSPMRSPPPRRRSPPGMYRRSSRSPQYKRRGSPYSPRRGSPSRKSPPRTGNRTRSVSPQPVKHRLPSPGRSMVRSHLPSTVRSSTNSRRGSPSATREHSPSGQRSPGKRTRSPGQGDTNIKEEDNHISKKRRTLHGEPAHNPSAGSPMRDVKMEPEERPIPHRSDVGPPTEPRSFRDSTHHAPAVLRVKTEPQDVEMVDGTAIIPSPASATPATPAALKAPKAPVVKPSSTPGPSAGVLQQPPTPVVTIPKMPAWKKDSVTPELDAEIERVRLLRINLAAEHNNITTAVRRALYELELVDFDLKGSEARLAVAQKQSELAAKGMPIYIEDNVGTGASEMHLV